MKMDIDKGINGSGETVWILTKHLDQAYVTDRFTSKEEAKSWAQWTWDGEIVDHTGEWEAP